MQVKLLTTQYISEGGHKQRYEPGDWVDVGRMTAQQWIAEGAATVPGLDQAEAIVGDLSGCYLMVRGGLRQAQAIASKYHSLTCEIWDSWLSGERHLIWNPREIKLTPEQAIVGFSRIEKTRPEYDAWEIAVMLQGKEALAVHYGAQVERNKTKKITGDLRIPVYNTAALWVRKTPLTRKLVKLWDTETQAGADERHAFLRALYQVPEILINTLPAGWLGIR
jgi:hypothetical protein